MDPADGDAESIEVMRARHKKETRDLETKHRFLLKQAKGKAKKAEAEAQVYTLYIYLYCGTLVLLSA